MVCHHKTAQKTGRTHAAKRSFVSRNVATALSIFSFGYMYKRA